MSDTNEAEIPSELISKCIATLLMIQVNTIYSISFFLSCWLVPLFHNSSTFPKLLCFFWTGYYEMINALECPRWKFPCLDYLSLSVLYWTLDFRVECLFFAWHKMFHNIQMMLPILPKILLTVQYKLSRRCIVNCVFGSMINGG